MCAIGGVHFTSKAAGGGATAGDGATLKAVLPIAWIYHGSASYQLDRHAITA